MTIEQLQTTPATNGNTNSFAARKWCFTIPRDAYAPEFLFQELQKITKSFIFQEEVGETTKYKHLQGYLELKKKNRLSFLTNNIGTYHFEVCRNPQASIQYCSDPTKKRIGEPYSYNIDIPYNGEDLIQSPDYNKWQKFIYNMIQTAPHDRHIYWFFDYKGGSGKSKFSKSLAFYNNKICMTTATKSADILTCTEKHFTTYIFDFPRSIGDFTPFNALEQIKNGFITDCKLKKSGRTLFFKPPHLIIFANRPPQTEKLSKDRWKIYEIVNDDIIPIQLDDFETCIHTGECDTIPL